MCKGKNDNNGVKKNIFQHQKCYLRKQQQTVPKYPMLLYLFNMESFGK